MGQGRAVLGSDELFTVIQFYREAKGYSAAGALPVAHVGTSRRALMEGAGGVGVTRGACVRQARHASRHSECSRVASTTFTGNFSTKWGRKESAGQREGQVYRQPSGERSWKAGQAQHARRQPR